MSYITRWNPLPQMDDFFRTYSHSSSMKSPEQDWSPTVDILEDPNEFLIKAEVAGLSKEDIQVKIHNGVLTLSGERKLEQKDKKQHRLERYYGSFSRSFSLPDHIDTSNIQAEQKDGLLTLHLPKKEGPTARTLDIKVT